MYKRLRGTRLVLLVPMIIILIIVLSAALAGIISPHSPYQISLPDKLHPPVWSQGGSWTYPLGTDTLGRDMLSRIIFGTRISLSMSLIVIVIGGGVGTAIALIAGYMGGAIDSFLMRVVDSALALPAILIALLLATVLGPSFLNVVVAISAVIWSRFARVIRGEVMSLKGKDFVCQAKVNGCSTLRILVLYLLPNVMGTLLVLCTLELGAVILVEASLSFLGAGIPPPAASWGLMVAEGRDYITQAWWVSLFPGIAIVLTVLSFNLLGDWLREILDPKLRQV